jgi:hypothetical protein
MSMQLAPAVSCCHCVIGSINWRFPNHKLAASLPS